MLGDHPPRRLSEEVLELKVLEARGAKHLEEDDGLVAHVLDKVGVVLGDDADVAGLVAKGARDAGCGEDGDTRVAADEVDPFVGVGVPVQATQAVRGDDDMGGGDGF